LAQKSLLNRETQAREVGVPFNRTSARRKVACKQRKQEWGGLGRDDLKNRKVSSVSLSLKGEGWGTGRVDLEGGQRELNRGKEQPSG